MKIANKQNKKYLYVQKIQYNNDWLYNEYLQIYVPKKRDYFLKIQCSHLELPSWTLIYINYCMPEI